MLVARDGTILVGGGAYFGATVPPLVRLTTSGSRDSSFVLQSGDGGVSALAELPDGQVLAGGSFDQIGGVVRRYLAEFRRTGSVNPDFASPSYPVYALGVLSSGGVISGGGDSTSGPNSVVARYAANGTLDATWHPVLKKVGVNGGIVQLTSGKFLVLGDFDSVRGRAAKGVARLNADGGVDPTFDSSGYRAQPYDRVVAAAPLGDGAVIAGIFSFPTSTLATPLAVLDANGAPDPGFSPRRSMVNYPETVAVLPDGRLVVAGYVNFDQGSQSAGSIAVYNRDGMLDASFAQGGQSTGGVRAVAVQRDGRIVAGGWMNGFNGRGIPCLVRLNRDGSLERSFAAAGLLTSVRQVRVLADGKILAAGFQPDARPVLLRFNADGTLDTSYRITTTEVCSSSTACAVPPRWPWWRRRRRS